MSSLVVVALPKEDDYVNKISSEKQAHLTLLYLGEDATQVKNLAKILNYVRHAAATSLCPFELFVDRRGELGDEKADVLFFSKRIYSDYSKISAFRSYLLKDNNIKTAYNSTAQFPEWLPHLTLGFPETPANEDTRDYPGTTWVSFDRIAVWFGDYEGVEFPLKYPEPSGVEMDIAWSDVDNRINDILEHYGIKGMKWGVRRDRTSSVNVSENRKKLKTSGGYGLPAHPDAIKARTIGQKGKASGLKALSDQELRDYANRLQLEQNVTRLNYNEKNRGQRFLASVLGKQGNALASEGLNKATKAAGKKALAVALA